MFFLFIISKTYTQDTIYTFNNILFYHNNIEEYITKGYIPISCEKEQYSVDKDKHFFCYPEIGSYNLKLATNFDTIHFFVIVKEKKKIPISYEPVVQRGGYWVYINSFLTSSPDEFKIEQFKVKLFFKLHNPQKYYKGKRKWECVLIATNYGNVLNENIKFLLKNVQPKVKFEFSDFLINHFETLFYADTTISIYCTPNP